jgi:hypothetical protein
VSDESELPQLLRVRPVDPLAYNVPIVDAQGRPTEQFGRQWVLARTVNLTTKDITLSVDDLRELLEQLQDTLAQMNIALQLLEGKLVQAGTGLAGGGAISTSPTLYIAPTGVTAGVYGSATHVPKLTINAQGQVTAAEEVAI